MEDNQATNLNSNPAQPQSIIVTQPKSKGLAFLLCFLFGPLGMLYTTITGAIVMFIVSLLAALITFGLGFFFTWPICIIWGVLAAGKGSVTVVK
ncbi:hypothetical protein F5984_11745 [Rudanella paleaurantiibacter]|uniref:Uncharacterized protein n=1 Tax=Rudanella paleaurantiibacter TaxID=2614655 RepID=A0A7J5U383_9BACT|nr:hypothetical protein [Rudanella paleaurantiibacter]KAB7731454.1 hypothetical protein F5984_11745 [Rudanella paleaurantiibacter]